MVCPAYKKYKGAPVIRNPFFGICVAVFGEPEYFGEGSGQAIAVVSPTYHLTEFSALFYL